MIGKNSISDSQHLEIALVDAHVYIVYGHTLKITHLVEI